MNVKSEGTRIVPPKKKYTQDTAVGDANPPPLSREVPLIPPHRFLSY